MNMQYIAEEICKVLFDFCKEYNKDLNGKYRAHLNLILSTSIFFSEFDHFLQWMLENQEALPFYVSWFKFSETEIELFNKLSASMPCQTAKERLMRVKNADSFRQMSYFKSPTDIIRLEYLDAPICILSCSINETINISKLSVDSNIYHLFDGYEKKCVNKEELELTAKLLEVRKSAVPLDPASLVLNTIKQKENCIAEKRRINIAGKWLELGNISDMKLFNDGGESYLFKLVSDANCIIKVFRHLSINKTEKLRFLLNPLTKSKLFADFCVLPKALVLSEEGETVGYTMDFISGIRLDRYAHGLSQQSDTTIVDVIRLFLNTALAVRAVHLSDLLIGDLYYDNFLVIDDGTVRIVDCDSFQIVNYPCDGHHLEAEEFNGKFLTFKHDFDLLKVMYGKLLELFDDATRDNYQKIERTYLLKINDVSGYIYAFYHYLHAKEKL